MPAENQLVYLLYSKIFCLDLGEREIRTIAKTNRTQLLRSNFQHKQCISTHRPIGTPNDMHTLHKYKRSFCRQFKQWPLRLEMTENERVLDETESFFILRNENMFQGTGKVLSSFDSQSGGRDVKCKLQWTSIQMAWSKNSDRRMGNEFENSTNYIHTKRTRLAISMQSTCPMPFLLVRMFRRWLHRTARAHAHCPHTLPHIIIYN